MTMTTWQHDIITNFFDVSGISGTRFMIIFLHKWLTRNQKQPWVLPNSWRLGWVKDTKFDTNVSNEMLLNTAKCQGHSFYCFWVIERNSTGGRGGWNYPSPRRLGLDISIWYLTPEIRNYCKKDNLGQKWIGSTSIGNDWSNTGSLKSG